MLFCDVAFFVKIFEGIIFIGGGWGEERESMGRGKRKEGPRISFLKCGFWESKGGRGGWGGG